MVEAFNRAQITPPLSIGFSRRRRDITMPIAIYSKFGLRDD